MDTSQSIKNFNIEYIFDPLLQNVERCNLINVQFAWSWVGSGLVTDQRQLLCQFLQMFVDVASHASEAATCDAKTAIINLTFATIVSMLLWRKLMYNFPNEESSFNKLKPCEVDRQREGPCWFDSFVRLNTLDNSFVTQTLAIQLLVIKVNILFQQHRKLNKAFMKWKLREQLSWYENLVSDHPYWLVIQPIGGERRLNHIQKKFSTFN